MVQYRKTFVASLLVLGILVCCSFSMGNFPVFTRVDALFTLMLVTTCSATDSSEVRVGAFNMKIFGQRKLENDDTIGIVIKIIHRYDLILLQEIRDVSETAVLTLLERVNSNTTDPYTMTVSPRLGRSVSKEQYAYMYRSSKLELVSEYVYSDPNDVFEREPYIALFSSTFTALSKFVVAGIHTKPVDALFEINNLEIVNEDIRQKLMVEEVIFAGDFNADCSYLPNRRWEEVNLRSNPHYQWLIDDDADTTVSGTDCAYDRFVIAGSDLQSAVRPCSAMTFNFDQEYGLNQSQAGAVSDHYPIEFSFLPSEFKASEPSLLIAAFNIQMFGQTKAGKDHVVDILAKIVKRYDLILIQEIQDSSDTAIEKLLEWSNRNNTDPFEYVVSERLGRTSNREQYAYFYRPSKLEIVESIVYKEQDGDVFQREPFIAHFKSSTTYVTEFAIAGIHTMPDEAVTEIDSLVDVYSAIQEQMGLEDVVFMGDLNADCSYVPKRRWSDIRLSTDPRFCWLIGNGTDTTVSSTDCAYDRFVIAGNALTKGVLPHTATVFRFDVAYGLDETTASEVSDHYPVEVHLRKGDAEMTTTVSVYSTTTQSGAALSKIGGRGRRLFFEYFLLFFSQICVRISS